MRQYVPGWGDALAMDQSVNEQSRRHPLSLSDRLSDQFVRHLLSGPFLKLITDTATRSAQRDYNVLWEDLPISSNSKLAAKEY